MDRYSSSRGSSRSGTSRNGSAIGAFDYKGWQDTNFAYNDDLYNSWIEQYKNQSWYNQLLENPWLWSKQGKFSPNLWQSISSAFGDDSAETNYFNTIQSNQSQWLSDKVAQLTQQDYNSASSQVAREQAAGLNPDLTGNVSAGEAEENDQPLLANPQLGPSADIRDIAGFFMNIYQLASGFAKDYYSLQSMANGVANEDLDLTNKIVSATTDYIKGRSWLGQVDTDSGSEYSFHVNTSDLEDYASKMFRSRSTRKRFIHEVQNSINSSRGRFAAFGSIRDAQDAKRALAQSIGQNEAYGNNEFDPMIIVYKNLADGERKISELQQNYSKDYLSEVNGKLQASAENKSNEGIVEEQESRSYQRKMDKIINRTMDNIVKGLESAANVGGIEGLLAKGMLMFISAYRLQMMPSLPSVNLRGLIDNRTNIFESQK